tara:strand:- start:21426 stop:21938 length:513 start_codon:yes stop_codon:yes gene_type:complete
VKSTPFASLPSWIGLALASTLLTACASSIKMEVHASNVDQIGKVYVMVSADISDNMKGQDYRPLILGNGLDNLIHCVAEVDATGWTVTKPPTSDTLEFEPISEPDEPPVARISVDEAFLEKNPEAMLGIVVRTTNDDLVGGYWDSGTLITSEGLTIQVSETGAVTFNPGG